MFVSICVCDYMCPLLFARSNYLYVCVSAHILLICELCSAALKKKVTHVHDHAFIKDNFLGIGKNSAFLSWAVS